MSAAELAQDFTMRSNLTVVLASWVPLVSRTLSSLRWESPPDRFEAIDIPFQQSAGAVTQPSSGANSHELRVERQSCLMNTYRAVRSERSVAVAHS